MKFRTLFLLSALSIILSCTFVKKSENTPANYPEFSWDHVPLYMHVRKTTAFTAEELEYLKNFPIITLEKTTGLETYGSTEKGSLEAAKAIKRIYPEAKVLYYRNVVVHYEGYDVNKSLAGVDHPFLADSSGDVKLVHNRVRSAYDLTNPDLRKWWLDHCIEMSAKEEIDGLFIDGNIKALEPAYLGAEIGREKKQDVAEGYNILMKDLRQGISPGKLIIANLIRARLPDSGLGYLEYFDGSYLEGIETEANGFTRVEYVARGIDAIQKAAREGKIICMSMGLGEAMKTETGIDDTRKRIEATPEIQARLNYCLAMFLICAEKYSYFLAHDGYYVNDNSSSVWLKLFPEYDKPLGPPKGPAIKNGYIYTREFEYASVWLDIENELAKIDWRTSK